MPGISDRTIGRLSLYRRLLNNLLAEGTQNVYSHQLAALAGGTAAQVRRDMMAIGYTGSPKRGYDVRELIESIGSFLDTPRTQGAALVGIGNLGRAIMSYFAGRRPKLTIQAAFDNDPYKINRVILGCRCYAVAELSAVVRDGDLKVGIITVPASEAQNIADMLVRAGVRGILNFAPVRLRVPPGVYVEDIDMTMSLEKVAYFARRQSRQQTSGEPPRADVPDASRPQ
jgi:redox-sensing transcriptional repressor